MKIFALLDGRKRSDGYILVDVMIALMLISISLVGIAALLLQIQGSVLNQGDQLTSQIASYQYILLEVLD